MAETVDDLLARALTDPTGTIAEASRRIEDAEGAQRVELLRALGNACRELRRTDESVSYLRDAVAAAEALGDDRLDGLATMSLAATLSYTGDFEASLQCAGRAVELLAGDDRVVALGQQAGLLARRVATTKPWRRSPLPWRRPPTRSMSWSAASSG